ncbi:MAG: phosphatidate cytidylyltransferase [Nitrospirae bacterium]|nr:phosphatidate cytidylyltransferase [Nitrospirota bacterium]
MREHTGRVLSALVALPVLYAVVRYLPPPLFAGLIAAVVLLTQLEFYRLVLGPGEPAGAWSARYPTMALGAAFGVGVILIAYHQAWDTAFPFMITALVMTVGGATLWFGKDLRLALVDAALAVFGVWYVAWMLSHLVLLRGLRGGDWLVLFALWVTWIGDSAAYYVGRAIGRTPLAPRVSPKKTVAGAVGGVVASAVASLVAATWFLDGLSWFEAVGLGIGGGLAGMTGDLVESMFKRSAGVKDSGGLIPAHGGLLDKVDGLLFTVPLFYYYLVWVKGYGPHSVTG